MILLFISGDTYTFALTNYWREELPKNVLYAGLHDKEYSDELEVGFNT